MAVEIKVVKSGKERSLFIHLPEKIHRGHKNWVPPIYLDEKNFFNPRKNKSFAYCDTVLAIAFRDKEPVGRIMGIINHRYNEKAGERDGRFCFMECYQDKEVFQALIGFIEEWARGKGMVNLVGPLGFSDKDPQGFMIEGFNETQVIATNGNLPYMPEMLEKEGYIKKVDLVVYKVPVPKEIPPFYKAIYERTLSNNHLEVLGFRKRKELRPFIHPILHLLNETFKDIYAFAPFEEYEMDEYANRYLLLLDPTFIKAVRDDHGNIVSFIIAMPDISKGLQACRGRLIPFGFLKVIAERNRSKQLNLLLGGIKEEYRGLGLDVIMGVKMLEEAGRRGMDCIDSHLELETNFRMRREMERMGGEVYKRFRIFQKKLMMH